MTSKKKKKSPKQTGEDKGIYGIPGRAGPAKALDPTRDTDEESAEDSGQTGQRSAPEPGVPVSDEIYEALKEKAKTRKNAPSTYAQEDPSAKRRK